MSVALTSCQPFFSTLANPEHLPYSVTKNKSAKIKIKLNEILKKQNQEDPPSHSPALFLIYETKKVSVRRPSSLIVQRGIKTMLLVK